MPDRQQSEDRIEDESPVVTEEDIAYIVASWTGVPVNKMTESQSQQLLSMEDTLHQRLIGQEQAVKAISRAVRRARVGISDPNRPIASFIFSLIIGVTADTIGFNPLFVAMGFFDLVGAIFLVMFIAERRERSAE